MENKSQEKLNKARTTVLTTILNHVETYGSFANPKICYREILNKHEGITKQSIEDICRGAAASYGCFDFVNVGSENIAVKNVNADMLKNAIDRLPGKDLLAFGNLVIEDKKSKIRYKETVKNFNSNNNIEKFLFLLANKPGQVITFSELIEVFGLTNLDEKAALDAIYRIKSDVLGFLKSLGVEEDIIKESVLIIRNKGYKFNPEPFITR